MQSTLAEAEAPMQTPGVVANRTVDVEGPTIGRQRIAYFDGGGDAPAIVFVHPNSCSVASWERQIVDDDALAAFRLIALDLPGHGTTTRLSEGINDYCISFYAEALVAFARALDLRNAVFVGHSLGGHAVIEAGASLPSAAGAMIFGSPPIRSAADFGAAFYKMPGGNHFLTRDLSNEDICHWEATVFYDEIPAWFARSVRETDPDARAKLGASLGTIGDESQLARAFPCPLAIVQGDCERTVRLDFLRELALPLWRGDVQLVKDANHFTQFDQAAAFNRLLADFAGDVTSR